MQCRKKKNKKKTKKKKTEKRTEKTQTHKNQKTNRQTQQNDNNKNDFLKAVESKIALFVNCSKTYLPTRLDGGMGGGRGWTDHLFIYWTYLKVKRNVIIFLQRWS